VLADSLKSTSDDLTLRPVVVLIGYCSGLFDVQVNMKQRPLLVRIIVLQELV
jgi:hypothetical protein